MNQVRANEEAVGSLMKKEKERRTQRIQKKMENEKKQRELSHIEEERKKEEEKQGECMRELVKWNDLCLSHLGLEGPLEDALQLLTSTPAVLLGKEGIKGCVAEGADADLLVLDENLNINSLFARGKVAVWEQEVKMKGRFEQ